MSNETTSILRQAIISTPWITLWVSEDGFMGILEMQQKVSVENMGEVMDQVCDCMEEWHPPQVGYLQLDLFKEGEV